MIDKDLTVIDLGGESWSRLLKLPAELARARASSSTARRALLVIFEGLKVLKAVDLLGGQDVEVDWLGSSRLDLVARQTGYPTVVALENSALSRLFGHAQREMDFRADMIEQWGAFARGVSREWRRTIFTYPAGPSRIPVVPHRVLQAAVSALIPDETVGLLAITDRGKVWASLVVGYRGGDFWLLSSLDAIDMEEADLSDGRLELAVGDLADRFGGRVRALAIERDLLFKIFTARLPAAELLWGLNSGELKTIDYPRRWKALLAAGSLLATRRRQGASPGREKAPPRGRRLRETSPR
jgi:hypothetical protein